MHRIDEMPASDYEDNAEGERSLILFATNPISRRYRSAGSKHRKIK
jgi:hypothetical protein